MQPKVKSSCGSANSDKVISPVCVLIGWRRAGDPERAVLRLRSEESCFRPPTPQPAQSQRHRSRTGLWQSECENSETECWVVLVTVYVVSYFKTSMELLSHRFLLNNLLLLIHLTTDVAPLDRTSWTVWQRKTTRRSSSDPQELWCRRWSVRKTDSTLSQTLASGRTPQATEVTNARPWDFWHPWYELRDQRLCTNYSLTEFKEHPTADFLLFHVMKCSRVQLLPIFLFMMHICKSLTCADVSWVVKNNVTYTAITETWTWM